MRLSVYGYFKHLLETRGEQATLNNIQKSQKSVDAYAVTAEVVQQGFPVRLLDAAELLRTLASVQNSLQEILPVLMRMTDPAILYFLLKFDFPEEAKKFEPAALDLMRRYPGIVRTLPRAFFKE